MDLISYFTKNTRVTFLLSVILLLFGFLGFKQLKSESIPSVDFGTVVVLTAYPGASPEEVEDLVTSKIEQELKSVEGIKKVKSISQSGLSEITINLELDKGFNTDEITNDIQRAVLSVNDLPAELPSTPKVTKIDSEKIPVIEYAVFGGDENSRSLMAEQLKNKLEDLEDISAVNLTGLGDLELQVLLDEKKLQEFQISPQEVARSLRGNLVNIPGGYLKDDKNEKLVRISAKKLDLNYIENLIVRGTFGGGNVRIKDISKVVLARSEKSLITRVDSQPAVLITITKKPSSDTIKSVEKVEKLISQVKIPDGLNLVVFNNEKVRVANRLDIVLSNALSGLFLILVVLLVLLPGRIGLVASLSVPMILLSLIGSMVYFNISFNAISMIALVIVLGLLVDNSAVVAEGYAKNRSEGLNPEEAAIKSAKLFFIPILATVLCNVAGFAPMLVTTGVLGQFVYSIPVIVSLAVVFSLIETFWLLPARLKFTLKNPPKPVDENTGFENNLFGKIQFKFFKIAKKLNSYKYLTLFLVILFFISSLFVAFKFNKFELFPREQSEVYTARFETKVGNNLKSTDEQAKDFSLKIEETLKNNQIKYNAIVTRIGTSKMRSEDVAGKNASHVGMIYLSIPLEEALRLNTKEVLNILKSIPSNLNQVVWQEAGAGPPVGKPLTLIIRHNDFNKLKAYQKKIEEELSKVSGLINIENDLYRSPDEYGFEIDLDLIKEVGLSVEELGRSLQTSLVGDVVAKYNYQSKELDVRIKNQDEDKTNIENVLNITVKNPEGNYIPLKSFMKVNSQEGPYIRKRYEYQSAITITGDINDLTSSLEVNSQARKILKSLQEKDSELSFFLGGEEENTRESFQSLLSALIISVLAILLILVLVYKSFLQSFLVLSTIPLGLAGVSYVFALAERPLSFMAFIGVIGLGGVVVNASIVLVSFINEAKKQNPEKDLVLLVSEVTALRFKAVFITNATTIMGLLPTAYGLGGNDVLLIPLTLAMGWGLIVGSLLALVWIPAGYLVIEQIKGKIYGKRRSS